MFCNRLMLEAKTRGGYIGSLAHYIRLQKADLIMNSSQQTWTTDHEEDVCKICNVIVLFCPCYWMYLLQSLTLIFNYAFLVLHPVSLYYTHLHPFDRGFYLKCLTSEGQHWSSIAVGDLGVSIKYHICSMSARRSGKEEQGLRRWVTLGKDEFWRDYYRYCRWGQKGYHCSGGNWKLIIAWTVVALLCMNTKARRHLRCRKVGLLVFWFDSGKLPGQKSISGRVDVADAATFLTICVKGVLPNVLCRVCGRR